jgi:hypothetical protein
MGLHITGLDDDQYEKSTRTCSYTHGAVSSLLPSPHVRTPTRLVSTWHIFPVDPDVLEVLDDAVRALTASLLLHLLPPSTSTPSPSSFHSALPPASSPGTQPWPVAPRILTHPHPHPHTQPPPFLTWNSSPAWGTPLSPTICTAMLGPAASGVMPVPSLMVRTLP